MKNNVMTARKLRVILFILLVIIFAGATAGFVFLRKNMNEYAVAISKLNADAASGDRNLQTLKSVETKLENNKDAIDAAKSVLADKQNYAEKVAEQLFLIEKETKVPIDSIDFASSQSDVAAAPTAPTPQTPGALPSAPGATQAGIQSEAVTVALGSPLSYDNFMAFLKRIETSPVQMQVDSVSLTVGADGSVSTPSLSIKVLVK